VGVAGSGAIVLVDRLFMPRGKVAMCDRPDAAVVFGRWGDPDRGEELVVVRRNPSSLEVHCHGGMAASEAVMRSLESLGAVRQPWPEWLAAGGATEIEAEARQALARAGGPKAAMILSRQLAGALQQEITRVRSLELAGEAAAAQAAIDRLRRAARVGLRLTRPWRVVVAGPVNAGKSSLVNALAGYSRSIVSAEPGTTRDLLETRLVLGGWEIDLVDTAGLRNEDVGSVEREGIARAITATADADLVLRVDDGRTGFSLSGPDEMLVLSKCDLSPDNSSWVHHAIRTSAATGQGVDELAAAIVERLVPEEEDDPTLLSGAVPFTERQMRALQ
jgi:tRNA modification GTPase